MLAWLKGFPITHYLIMAAIGWALWTQADLALTKDALEDQRELTAQYENALEVVQDIDRRDTIIIRASDEADRAIQEAPNADTLVPPDVASAWAAGIDSVRDAGTEPADGHDLLGPSRDTAEPRGIDSGRTVSVLEGPRGSFLEV